MTVYLTDLIKKMLFVHLMLKVSAFENYGKCHFTSVNMIHMHRKRLKRERERERERNGT